MTDICTTNGDVTSDSINTVKLTVPVLSTFKMPLLIYCVICLILSEALVKVRTDSRQNYEN